MDTTYKPKHKKPEGYAGSTPRGPARWFRAADVAMRKPNTKGGRLFWTRTRNALTLAESWDDLAEGPFAHIENVYGYNYEHRYVPIDRKISYYTCSMFCCSMVTQLDIGTTSIAVLEEYFMENEMAPIGGLKPQRTARCQFCSTRIKP